jgi:hypothetical protein
MTRVGFSSASSSSNSNNGGGTIPPLNSRDLLFNALDLKVTYQWYDPATSLERIKAIFYTSPSLGSVTVKQFFYTPNNVLEGSAWVYPGSLTQQLVDSTGGTVVGPDGVSSMIVPSGVLNPPVNLSMSFGQDTTLSFSSDGLTFGSAITFGPSGTTFFNPITINFQLYKSTAPNSVIQLYVQSGGTWIQAGTATVDPSGVFATGQVNRI